MDMSNMENGLWKIFRKLFSWKSFLFSVFCSFLLLSLFMPPLTRLLHVRSKQAAPSPKSVGVSAWPDKRYLFLIAPLPSCDHFASIVIAPPPESIPSASAQHPDMVKDDAPRAKAFQSRPSLSAAALYCWVLGQCLHASVYPI